MKNFKRIGLLTILSLTLMGCSGFNGIRQPLYDGSPVVVDEEAIETYQTSSEVIGEEKDYYFRNPFSEAIYGESLDYPIEAPLLLEEGKYTIGEDLPAGRVSLLGNESFFSRDSAVIRVGNLKILDEQGAIYFENLFHSEYGPLVAQVDFIPGHTIEIVGQSPEITIFYSDSFPDNPYQLMDPPQVLVNLERLEVKDPVVYQGKAVELSAGIYEAGIHLEAGKYEIQSVEAPHNTEMFLFRNGEEPRVFELILTADLSPEEEQEGTYPVFEIKDGDKIYPNLVRNLRIVRVNE